MSHSADHQRLSTACQLISTGRSVARQLTAAVRRFGLNETEFRLLWLLRESVNSQKPLRVNQRDLASQLGLSPAQVSTSVEKLRSQGAIESVADSRDRRIQLWQLTEEGAERFMAICFALEQISRNWVMPDAAYADNPPAQGDAA